MAEVKDIIIKRIDSKSASTFVKKNHYSGKVVNNSQLHFGAFLGARLHGVLSFGPSMMKHKLIHIVKETSWNEFVELNRMVFDETLPRNSESRALSVCLRLIKKNCPHIKWIVSFADGMQCGDGTIYRAAGFKLTGISQGSMWKLPEDLAKKFNSTMAHEVSMRQKSTKLSQFLINEFGGTGPSIKSCIEKFGGERLPGYMFRYIYFLKKECENLLTCPIIPYSKIAEIGGKMYKGEKPRGDSVPVAHQAPSLEEAFNSTSPLL